MTSTPDAGPSDAPRRGTQTYQVTDLWTGTTSTAAGTLAVPLDTHSGKLLELH